MWSYTDAIKTDQRRGNIDPITGESVEDAFKLYSLDDRIAKKFN